MLKLSNKQSGRSLSGITAVASLFAVGSLLLALDMASAYERFERIYTGQGAAHLTISNTNGSITVRVWDKKSISVRAVTSPPASIEDHSSGSDIKLMVKRTLPPGQANFQVSVPANTSVTLSNVMGRIDAQGLTGHVSVNSIDGDVRLLQMRPSSLDVRVTNGEIIFDGELHSNGSYLLQTMRGDIDVSLPASAPFNLDARSLSGVINLGDFLNSLTGTSRGPKAISGTNHRGGPRLSLTTYNGRILLHKK